MTCRSYNRSWVQVLTRVLTHISLLLFKRSVSRKHSARFVSASPWLLGLTVPSGMGTTDWTSKVPAGFWTRHGELLLLEMQRMSLSHRKQRCLHSQKLWKPALLKTTWTLPVSKLTAHNVCLCAAAGHTRSKQRFHSALSSHTSCNSEERQSSASKRSADCDGLDELENYRRK